MQHNEKEIYQAPAMDVWLVRVENGFEGTSGSTAELEDLPGFEIETW